MKGIQVRWPRRPWNRASPSNPAIRKYGIEMAAWHPHWSEAVHRHVVSTSSHEQPRVHLTSMCIYTTISMLYFLVAGFEGEALFHDLRCRLTWIPFIISMGISKFTCVWDPRIVAAYDIIHNTSGILVKVRQNLVVDVICIEVVVVNLSNCCKMQNDTLIVSMYCICR